MTAAGTDDMVDLLVHSRVRIAAPPAAIWPHFATFDWMTAPKLAAVAGEPGTLGERFEAYLDGVMETVAYHVVNVELVPDVRRTIRIEGLDGVAMGFTAFELIPSGTETIATYDVYIRTTLPEGLSASDLLETSQRGGDEAMLQLKALVERISA